MIMLLSNILFSQDINDSIHELGFVIETNPEYEGGENELLKLFNDSINYPVKAIEDSIEGIVFVEFWIDTNGITTNHRIIKGIREDLDHEALRVAKLIKYKKPAMQRGKPIMVRYTIPIDFRIPDNRKRIRRNENK